MKTAIKGLLIGAILGTGLYFASIMIGDIADGVRVWRSCTPQERAEIKQIISCIKGV